MTHRRRLSSVLSCAVLLSLVGTNAAWAMPGAQPPAPPGLYLKSGSFAPGTGQQPAIPPGLAIAGYNAQQRGYYIVQFAGPILQEWRDAVTATGADVVAYLPDFARGLITLSQHSVAYGRAWHTPNQQTVSTVELIRLIGAELGTPITTRTVSPLMLALAGLFVPIVREMKEMRYEFEEAYIVDDSQFRAAFDAVTTPLPDAVRATVAWFRQQHAQAMKQAA